MATEEAAINLKVTEARTVVAGVEVNNKVVMVEAIMLHRLPVAGIKEANKVVMAAETLVEAMVLHRLVS